MSVVPLSDIRKEPGSIAITFDDGFANFEEHALPALTSNGFAATVFLVSDYCGRQNDWPTQPCGVPRLPLLSWERVRSIQSPAIEWGAHTVSHPDLTRLPAEAAGNEIRESRDTIEQQTGTRVRALAYPYGAADAVARTVAAAEFELACGTRLDFLRADSDTAELPRIDTYYLRNPIWLERLLRPSGRGYIGGRRALREVRRWLAPR